MSNFWHRFKWVFEIYVNLKRTSYPRSRMGSRLLICAALLPSGGFLQQLFVQFEEGYIIKGLGISQGDFTLWTIVFGVVLLFSGVSLIYSELRLRARNVAKAIISFPPSQSANFPNEILDPAEKEFWREPVVFSLGTSIVDDGSSQYKRLASEFEADVVRRFVVHENCTKLYLGGIARVPILVGYGRLFRSIDAKTIYFDQLHKDGQKQLLDEVDEQIILQSTQCDVSLNKNKAVGLALSCTAEIRIEHLPLELRESTIFLRPNTSLSRNLFRNQDNLERFVDEVVGYIDELSKSVNCDAIYFFLSVQSSLAIALGRRFQEGTHKNWIIPNFNYQKGQYEWAIKLVANGLEYIPDINKSSD